MMTKAEQVKYIKDNYLKLSQKQIAGDIGRSETFVRRIIKKYDLVIPEKVKNKFIQASRFKKGHVPFNKGKKMSEYLSPESIEKIIKTTFKKCSLPKNHKKVGTIVTRKDSKGYLYRFIKIQEPDKWELYHRYIWDQKYGTIPVGMNIQFKDGNTLNCSIENLYMIHRSDQAIVNKNGGLPFEFHGVVLAVTQLNKKVKKLG